MLFKVVNSQISPAGMKARLTILIFHRVLKNADPLMPSEPDATRFREILGWVKDSFNVIPLDIAVERLATGQLPPAALSITFDDGYADNYDVALPILQEFGMSATFFVASDFLDGGCMWNDRVVESIRRAPGASLDLSSFGMESVSLATEADRIDAISRFLGFAKYLGPQDRAYNVEKLVECCNAKMPADLMMTSEQLRNLHRTGMVIGGHTCSHPILASLSESNAAREIAEGKESLEAILGESIRLFAYPNGKPGKDYLSDHVRMVKEAGYFGAVSTAAGAASLGSDLFQLPRFTPWDLTPARFKLRLVNNFRSRGAFAKN